MATERDYILCGPKEEYAIWFESLGIYLYECLKRRKENDILVINAVSNTILTCGEVLNASIKLCQLLKSIPLRTGDVVAIISENVPSTYVALLGTLLAGTTALLLNFAYTARELKHAFNIGKPRMVLCSSSVVPNLVQIKDEIMCKFDVITIEGKHSNFPTIHSLIDNIPTIDFRIEDVEIQETAFLLLSSGTTGLPKCTKVSNHNLISTINVINDIRYLDVTKDDVVISILPFFHIYGLCVNMSAIVAETKTVMLQKFNANLFLQSIQEYRVTKLITVPPILHFLLKSETVHNYDISSIRDICVGGASLGNDLYEEFIKRFPNVSIRQLYGLTETGGVCTIQKRTDSCGDVGSLISNLQCKVLDLSTNRPVGPLQVGELCFKGIGISSGYYKMDTAFVDDDGFYRTGDVGYYDEDGRIFIVDRIKEIIKYKGFQVSPSELEDVLLSHPDVRDCGVIGIPNERAGQLPLAFVVRQTGKDISEQELVEYVAENLTVHKQLHGGVQFIEEIPRNASGKILRRELNNKIATKN